MLPLTIQPVTTGSLVGLAPQTKLQAPQNRNIKHFTSVEFCQILECEAPPHKRKAPLLTTFWRRFCAKT